MRLTKSFCALAALIALLRPSPLPAQAPADEGGPSPNNDAVREALRKALETGAATTSAVPAIRVELVSPGTNAAIHPRALPSFYPYAATNIVITTNGTFVRLSLEEAIRLALEHNLNLQVERYTPLIAEYDRRATYGYYDPIFSGAVGQSHTTSESGGFNANTGVANPGNSRRSDFIESGLGGYLPSGLRYDIVEDFTRTHAVSPQDTGRTDAFGNTIFTNRVTDTWNAQGSIAATQPLLRDFWIDAPRLQIKLKRRDLRISELVFERLVMDIINQVEQAYYKLIADRELVRVGEADVSVKKQFLDENHRRVEVGTIAPLDEKLAQAELAKSEINLITARKNALDSEALLKGLIHDNFVSQLDVRLELTDRLLAMPAKLEEFEAFKEAMEKRPDLQGERVKLEKQQIQLKFDKNQIYPRLDIIATWGVNGLDRHFPGAWEDQYNRRFPQDRYGLQLIMPLSMWKERNNLKSSQAALEKQVLAYKLLEETVIHEVDFQLRLLRTTWNIIPLRREQTAYEQAALEAERKKEAAGKSTSFNVLKIASDLTTAQSDEIGTLRDYNQAVSELNYRKGTTLERWHIDRPAPANR
jgi:outer membrane protein